MKRILLVALMLIFFSGCKGGGGGNTYTAYSAFPSYDASASSSGDQVTCTHTYINGKLMKL